MYIVRFVVDSKTGNIMLSQRVEFEYNFINHLLPVLLIRAVLRLAGCSVKIKYPDTKDVSVTKVES
jgi:hypothetical protein